METNSSHSAKSGAGISDMLRIRTSRAGTCVEESSFSLLLRLTEHNTLGLQSEYQKLNTSTKLKYKTMVLSKNIYSWKCCKKVLELKYETCKHCKNQ